MADGDPLYDDDGNPRYDDDGNPLYETTGEDCCCVETCDYCTETPARWRLTYADHTLCGPCMTGDGFTYITLSAGVLNGTYDLDRVPGSTNPCVWTLTVEDHFTVDVYDDAGCTAFNRTVSAHLNLDLRLSPPGGATIFAELTWNDPGGGLDGGHSRLHYASTIAGVDTTGIDDDLQPCDEDSAPYGPFFNQFGTCNPLSDIGTGGTVEVTPLF